MNSAMRDTGTAMSCLIETPSIFCASEIFSRKAHSAAACDSLAASTASVDDTLLRGTLQRLFQRCRQIVARPAEFDQHLPRRLAGERIARVRNVFEHQVQGGTADDFEGRHVVACRVSQSPEQARPQQPGSGTATQATACVRGRGKSFSVAAVIRPSVPSAPMNRCLRS